MKGITVSYFGGCYQALVASDHGVRVQIGAAGLTPRQAEQNAIALLRGNLAELETALSRFGETCTFRQVAQAIAESALN